MPARPTDDMQLFARHFRLPVGADGESRVDKIAERRHYALFTTNW